MDYRRTSLLRGYRERRLVEPPRAIVQVVTGDSWFMRIATVVNITASIVLAGAALWIGQLYKAQEQLDQKARQAENARQAIFAARYQCRDLTYKAMHALREDASPDQRKDAASFIGAIDTDCRRVGEPIGRFIGNLEKLAEAQPAEVRQSIAALRRKLAAPLPPPKPSDANAAAVSSAAILTSMGRFVESYGAYERGRAGLSGTGLLNFKKHVDNPSENELDHATDSNAFEANF